jgi:hypothetical protein
MISRKFSLVATLFLSLTILLSATVTAAQETCSAGMQHAPIITRDELKCVAALTIEKGDNEPSDEQYATIRNVLMQASSMGFNTWRGFFNPHEVRSHMNMEAGDPNHLPHFGRSTGLVFIADTVDAVIPQLNDADLSAYIKGLEAMGAMALVFNDADQYPIEALENMVGRVRVLSDLPIIASLRASANIAGYAMFDYVEAQTFGTTNELLDFLVLPFDLYCLDARETMTAATLRERGEMILAANPKAFFYYAAEAGDWLAMPAEEADAIESIIERWKNY